MSMIQFTTSEPNPSFAEMRRGSYNDYCCDCVYEGLKPIDWVTWKRLVGELLAKGSGGAWACMYAQKVAFERYHD